MSRDETLKQLAQNGCFAADGKVMASIAAGATGAEQTRVAITTALDQLEQQGFITFVAPEEWPEYMEVR